MTTERLRPREVIAMRIAVFIAGVIHACLPEAARQMSMNEAEQPFDHPLIDRLDLKDSRLKAAARPRPRPVASNAIFIGGRYIERAA